MITLIRITRTSRVFLILLLLVTPLTASVADSAKDMLAAGRIDEAIAELNGRLSSAPADAESSNLLCRAYFALEDWDRAESSCRKAASLAPDNSRFHLWLGRVYGEKADRANFLAAASLAGKVRGEFERAVQLNTKDIEARLDLAEFYIDAPGIVGGGEQKAREQAQFIGTVDPGREHWIYARIAEKKKDFATAEHEYHQYIELSKGDAEAWLNLALFFRHQKRFDEMEQAIVKLSQAPNPEPDVLWEASAMLERAGRSYPLATELVNRYLASGPVEKAPAFRAHYLRGALLEKQGDKAGAAREYRASLSLAHSYGSAQQALNRVAHE
ncbi:MAG TPA: tetratricopeptide repeat protein [Terriglobales bacterium]|jgi:tetratricopeptide (TPR) repeat protein|nr:tetratricopeptide repeat protein [Terriglobales bacterium]